ncbi:MAG TPA: glycosyltransferase family 87 protein [Vicinamibacteria bacterium]|nr:glycosyltransferase family 87 protein [Vicinamibacteria bacterium]
MSRGRRWTRVVLVLALAAAAIRLGVQAARFGRESVQADFSAFYTAGQAARAGLSPYWTAPDRDPPLWDGVSLYETSRFLYPPLAASLFAPLTLLGYTAAKHLWMALTLAAVAGALVVLARALGARPSPEVVLALAAFAGLFHPLLLHLERGQVDALTLLVIALALRPMVADGRDAVGSGVLLALGSVLKPNVAWLLPFLVLRRRWRALAGFAIGAAGLALAAVALHGTDGVGAYVTRELPRIAVEGEAHGDQRRLDPAVLARLRGGAPEGMTARDGRLYRVESFRFVTNASLTRPLKRGLGLRLSPRRLSLLVLSALVGIVALWQLGHGRLLASPSPLRELAYWQAALAAVLLAWPVTWAMNAVWLLPTALVVAYAWPFARTFGARAALAGCVCGLLLAGAPDGMVEVALGPWTRFKYVIGEMLVFVSLLGGSARLSDRTMADGRRGDNEP